MTPRVGLATVAGAGLVVAPATASADRIVYVNTSPIVLNNASGQDPSADSYNANGFVPGPLSGWPSLTVEQRDELLFWLREATVPFDITYTFVEPMSPGYDMVVMGTQADVAAMFPEIACSTAVGLADCGDLNGDNISFLFWECMPAVQQADMHRVAFNMLTALGFGWGLENVSATGQIGGSYANDGLVFGDTCVPTTQALCADHLACAAGQQNSTADLTARLGARVDNGPPAVTITSPEPGPSPSSFAVDATVADTYGGLVVTLSVVEAGQEVLDDMPPYHWDLDNVPDGAWTLEVRAIDADLNEVTASVVVCVGDGSCDGGTGSDGGTAASSSDDGSLDDSTSASPTTGIDPTTGAATQAGGSTTTGPVDPTMPFDATSFGQDGPDAGCTCRHGERVPDAAWLWMGLVPMLVRRRPRVTRCG